MGSDIPKESSGPGPIRRFPAGFWAVFNQWWHGEFTRQGQRPSSKAIGKWHAENALKVWGASAVSYAETQRHANRMKCRRTGPPTVRHATTEDDDDDEDYCPDSSIREAIEAAAAPPSWPDKQTSAEGASTLAIDHAQEAHTGAHLDAHSDPPGALRSYMNADSDLPAPAAPSRDAALHLAPGKPAAKASWMHPDPVGSTNPAGLCQSSDAGASALSWNSSFSIVGRGGDVACSAAATPHDTSAGLSRALKRGRDGSARGFNGTTAMHEESQPLSINPFADVAAAAAAAAGLPIAHALPAARDAAALLNSAALAGPTRYALMDAKGAPAWLQRVSQELDALMQELGISLLDGGGPGSHFAMPRRARALCSTEPLSLPEPGRKRDLDSLLRRGLRGSGNDVAAAAVQREADAVALPRGPAAVEPSLHSRGLQGRERLGQAAWPGWKPAAGGGGGGSGVLTAIDSMPLEALL